MQLNLAKLLQGGPFHEKLRTLPISERVCSQVSWYEGLHLSSNPICSNKENEGYFETAAEWS